MEGPAGAPGQLHAASLEALPDAAFELIAAELPPEDLRSLRAACSAGHTAADTHCAATIGVPLLPGEARPLALPSLVQRWPKASTLRFITYKGRSPRLAWEHEQAVAELRRCLDQQALQGLPPNAAAHGTRLRLGAPPAGAAAKGAGEATQRLHVAGREAAPPPPPPPPSAGSPTWSRIRRIVECPAECVEPLARLCPNAEAISVCTSAAGRVSRAAFQALGRLSALTRLGVADLRQGCHGSHSSRAGLDEGFWGAIGSMPQLRSLTMDCQPSTWDVPAMSCLPPALTELRLRGGVEAYASMGTVTSLAGLVCLELGGGKQLGRGVSLSRLGTPRLAALTSLELGLESVGDGRWLYEMTALVRLSLPCAELDNYCLGDIADAAPQLTSLHAKSLSANCGLNAHLPELVELSAHVERSASPILDQFAPSLRVVELEGSYTEDRYGDGWDLGMLSSAGHPLRLALDAPLGSCTAVFGMMRRGCLAGVDLRAPLDAAWSTPSNSPEADECARQEAMCVFAEFCHTVLNAALRYEERELSMRAEGSMLEFVLRAATHAPRIGALRLEFMSMWGPPEGGGGGAERDLQVEESIAAAMCLRQLSSLELLFAPWAPAAAGGMTDAHLEQIANTRPRSLARVVLRNARHVTPACAAMVMRRAREEGRPPLDVTLTYGDVSP